MRFYLASGLDNIEAAKALAAQLVAAGHTDTYDWRKLGPAQALGPLVWREVAEAELEGVRTAQFVVALLPGARGTHVELGAALADPRKHVFLVSLDKELILPTGPNARTCAFYWHPRVTRYVDTSVELLAQGITERLVFASLL